MIDNRPDEGRSNLANELRSLIEDWPMRSLLLRAILGCLLTAYLTLAIEKTSLVVPLPVDRKLTVHCFAPDGDSGPHPSFIMWHGGG